MTGRVLRILICNCVICSHEREKKKKKNVHDIICGRFNVEDSMERCTGHYGGFLCQFW